MLYRPPPTVPAVIVVCGSRQAARPRDLFFKLVDGFTQSYGRGFTPQKSVLIHGGCPEGGDRWAEELRPEFGTVVVMPFESGSKAGGFTRNKKMVEKAKLLWSTLGLLPYCCAMPVGLEFDPRALLSKGTFNTVYWANSCRIPTLTIECEKAL